MASKKSKDKDAARLRTTSRVEAGLVEEDFQQQPADEVIAAGEQFDLEAMEDQLALERASGVQNPTGVVLAEPSRKLNPYASEEEQGMEMTAKVFGPPQYGSPDPTTSAGKLATLEDGHPLYELPEGMTARISDDYGQVGTVLAPGEGIAHPGAPGRSDLERHSSGDFSDETDATESARETAAEAGVNLAEVKGTGKDGRITQDDVKAFVAERDAAANPES